MPDPFATGALHRGAFGGRRLGHRHGGGVIGFSGVGWGRGFGNPYFYDPYH